MAYSVEVAALGAFNAPALYVIEDFLRGSGADASWAKQIVAARDARPAKRFASLAEVGQIATIGSALLARYGPASPKAVGDQMGWTEIPVLLFPVRIETRFAGSELLVRIYPDRPLITTHEPRLTGAEVEAGRTYHKTAAADRPDAWRQLVARFGPRRSAWIKSNVDSSGLAPSAALRDDTGAGGQMPKLECLPDRFVVFLYRVDEEDQSEKLIRQQEGGPITSPLPVFAEPVAGAKGLFDGAAAWINDFGKAEAVGMAIRVKQLSSQDLSKGFSRVIVAGFRSGGAAAGSTQLVELLNRHRYTTGLGFVPWGTPTNNTQQAASGHSESSEDADASYKDEVGLPEAQPSSNAEHPSNARRLGVALGLGQAHSSLTALANSGDVSDTYADDLQTALWPATGDYVLRYLMPGLLSVVDTARLAEHFTRWVRARGPLPALRFGDLPYGVLPVSRVQAWKESSLDTASPTGVVDSQAVAFDRGLHTALRGLHGRWVTWAGDTDRVPKIGATQDPDKELLQVLSMSPVSVSYQVRPFLAQEFPAWLTMAMRDYLFGPGTPYAKLFATPYHAALQWSSIWSAMRTRQAQWWQSWTGAPVAQMAQAPLLGLTGWWQARDLETDLKVPFARTAAEQASNSTLDLSKPQTVLGAVIDLARKVADASPFKRTKVEQKISVLVTVPGDLVERLFRDLLDLCTNRLDAWITSLATKRLADVREGTTTGIHLGAFGYTENLRRRAAPTSAGYVHAPSRAQAAAGAVLHNAYLTHADAGAPNPFRINLSSERVSRAVRILDGMRQGQPLGALLGYQFERELHDSQMDQYIDDFRAAFPLVVAKGAVPESDESVEAMAARDVVDGLALSRWCDDQQRTDIGSGDTDARQRVSKMLDDEKPEYNAPLLRAVMRVQGTLDAVSDVLMYEGVYQAVQGNYERGGAAIDAASGQVYPPELEAIRTPVGGKTLTHRVCVLLRSATPNSAQGPRAQIEPRVAAWAQDLLGSPSDIGCGYILPDGTTGTVTVANLGLDCVDLLYLSGSPLKGELTEIEIRVDYLVRSRHKLKPEERARLDVSRVKEFRYGFEEALELARHALDLLGAGTPLRPDSMVATEEGARVSFLDGDVEKLRTRVVAARNLLQSTGRQLATATIIGGGRLPILPGSTSVATTPAALRGALMDASRWGIPSAIPTGLDDVAVRKRCVEVLTVINERAASCLRLLQQEDADRLAAAPTNGRVRLLLEAAGALFANTVKVLPEFEDPGSLAGSFDRTGLLPAPLDEHRVRLWLQQVALVHEPVGKLDDLMLTADVWRQSTPGQEEKPAMKLHLAQLPSVANEPWFALDDTERGGQSLHADSQTVRGKVSIVAASNEIDATKTAPFAGVLLDRWDERIPAPKLDTSVAFQYDAPGNQAPQSLLLAVPGTRDTNAVWSAAELAEIVRDTMDLAKVRAVDADAMGRQLDDAKDAKGTGAVLPALMLPVDPLRPGSNRDPFANTIEDWIAKFQPSRAADFAGFFGGTGWGLLFEEMGFRVAMLSGGSLVRYALPGAAAEYPKTGVEFSWNTPPRGNAIAFTFFCVGLASLAPPKPVLTAYDSAGAVVPTVSGPWSQNTFAYPLPRTRRVRITGGRDAAGQMWWPINSIGLSGVTWP